VTTTLDTVLLIALPASGKSEVRKYLDLLDPGRCREEFHMGQTVQLDDFPYVHMMRRVDEELRARGHDGVFYKGENRPFAHPHDWGTLVELLNQDHARLLGRETLGREGAGERLLARLDECRTRVSGEPALAHLDAGLRTEIAAALDGEAGDLFADLDQVTDTDLEGKTVVLEFARGGPQGAPMPLPEPLGYQYSLARLSPEILDKLSILYIWVTPEESRRKNDARTDPNDPGSILHHGVPLEVMLEDYGCDDVEWLLEASGKPDTVAIEAHGRRWEVPLARFDNRVDKTSFVRDDRSMWSSEDERALHDGLAACFRRLAELAS
jgi:hypothetical protein